MDAIEEDESKPEEGDLRKVNLRIANLWRWNLLSLRSLNHRLHRLSLRVSLLPRTRGSAAPPLRSAKRK